MLGIELSGRAPSLGIQYPPVRAAGFEPVAAGAIEHDPIDYQVKIYDPKIPWAQYFPIIYMDGI